MTQAEAMELAPGMVIEGIYSGRKYQLLHRTKEGKRDGFAAREIEQKPFFMHEFSSYKIVNPGSTSSPTGSDTDTNGFKQI